VQLVVLSQSRDVKWNINVTQVHCGSLYLPCKYSTRLFVNPKNSLQTKIFSTVNDLCGARNAPIAGRGLDLNAISRTEPPWQFENASLPQGKILGGTPVGGIQYPWMASITSDGEFIAAGVLIARQWVMTSANVITF
jgi:hypothetical protein